MPGIVIFFDIGGTLLNSPDIFKAITAKLVGHVSDETAYNLVLKNFMRLAEPQQSGEAGQQFKSIVELHRTALALLASNYGYPDISDQARDICVDTYVHQSLYFPETEAVLEKLKRRNIRMVIASDNDIVGFNIQVPKFGFNRYFSGYCISETAKAYKPTQGFINHLKKHIPSDPTNCYFVGDSWVDVESGKRLGINSVLVDRKNAGNRLGADYVIHDLGGLLAILNLP